MGFFDDVFNTVSDITDPLNVFHNQGQPTFIEKGINDLVNGGERVLENVFDQGKKISDKGFKDFMSKEKQVADEIRRNAKDVMSFTEANAAKFVNDTPLFSSLGLGAISLTTVGLGLGGLIIILLALKFLI